MSNQINEQVKETLHIYTRVSTTQGSKSLDTQRELGEKQAKQLGMKSKVWNEGVAGATYKDLPSRRILRELLGEIGKGSVKHLFVENIDRLSRDEITLNTIKLFSQKKEVVLYTKDGRYDFSNPTDKLLVKMFDEITSYKNAIRAKEEVSA